MNRIKRAAIVLAALPALVLSGGSAAQAAGDGTYLHHSDNSARSGLYYKWSGGDFGTLQRGSTAYASAGVRPTDFYVPSGWCARKSMYYEGRYQNTYNFGAGWHALAPTFGHRVAFYDC